MNQSKPTKRKWVPLVMSTSLLASTILIAGGSASAEESGQADAYKNHGQYVSQLATSMSGSFAKGNGISTAAKSKASVNKEEQKAEGDQPAVEDTTTSEEEEPAVEDTTTSDEEQPAIEKPASDQPQSVEESSQEQDVWVVDNYKEIINDYSSLVDYFQQYLGDLFGDEQQQNDTGDRIRSNSG